MTWLQLFYTAALRAAIKAVHLLLAGCFWGPSAKRVCFVAWISYWISCHRGLSAKCWVPAGKRSFSKENLHLLVAYKNSMPVFCMIVSLWIAMVESHCCCHLQLIHCRLLNCRRHYFLEHRYHYRIRRMNSEAGNDTLVFVVVSPLARGAKLNWAPQTRKLGPLWANMWSSAVSPWC